MRHLSLKVKLTLLYAILMTAVVCGVLGLLFSFSGKELLAGVQNRLEKEVVSAGEDMEYKGGYLEFDSDLMDLEDGIYLSVYASDGTMLYGRIPYNFDNSVLFEDGSIRRYSTQEESFFVMDLYHKVEGYGMVVVRGVTSITKAEESFLGIMRTAAVLLPLMVILAAALGYFMTGRTLRPVSRVTETVQEIRKDGDFSRRIRLGKGRDEIYRMAETFDQMLDQVESSLKREQQFTSDVSHELRTPVAAILLQCEELLDNQKLNPEEREGIQMICRRTQYISQMIGQLLLLSRADQGREILHMEAVDFSELTSMAVETIREEGLDKGIRLHAQIQPELKMQGDETLLIRFWMNLLNNAVKYGKQEGNIWVTVIGEDGGIRGQVRDDGIGIMPEHLPHIWERFYQVDSSRTSQESSGLGLSMVQWIVKVHKGSISVDSVPEKGTAFTFWFPGS